MLKQQPFHTAARRTAHGLTATFLSAFLVFGNAVSAFGNGPAPADPPAKAEATAATGSEAAGQKSEGDAKPAAVGSKRRTAPRRVKAGAPKAAAYGGELFVVETAEVDQSSQSPSQRDARRPPGTEQRQTVPPEARPNPPSPQTPPGTERPAPQSPPGVEQPATQPRPGVAPTPGATPLPLEDQQTGTPTDPLQEAEDPNFPAVQPRPVPPVPSLTRIGVVSGDQLTLSLNEAVRRALENNNEIEVARNDVRLAESRLNSLRGIFDPVFTYQPEVNQSTRPVANIFGGAGTAGTVSTTDYRNDFAVNKQFSRGGGNLTYFFNNVRQSTSADNNSVNPFHSAAQGIEFTQPLWRDRSIDQNRQQIRIQQKRLEQSDADFRRRTIEIISQVQRAYWDLVFALRDEQNQIANLNLARENFRRTEASVAAGASAPLQRAEIQTELSNRESALLLSNQQVTVAENTLKSLLIKDPLSPDWSKVLVPVDQPAFTEAPVSLESALKEARDNRPEMRRLKLQEEINDIDLTYFKNQTKPRIDLTGTFQTNGLAGTPGLNPATGLPLQPCTGNEEVGQACLPRNFVGGYGQTLKNLFSFDTRQIIVGVTIQVPFKNRTAQANLATARIERDQLAAQTRSQEQSIEVEVRNAVQAVETARRRVLSAKLARESAEEQLAGERRLYQVGRSTTFLLFQRENALVNARNQELRAETDYNKAVAELQKATSTTLRANNVFIDSPFTPEK